MRGLSRLVALVLGLAVAAAAVLAGIETVLLVAGQPSLVVPRSTWAHHLAVLTWNDTLLDIAAAGVAVVGFFLILMALLPRRPVRILVGLPAPGTTWVSRSGLCRRVAHDVADVPEVDTAVARIHGRRVAVSARLAPGVSASEGRELVRDAATPLLGLLAPEVPLRLGVKVRATSDPVSTDTAPVPTGAAG
jgi:hypothetical protein